MRSAAQLLVLATTVLIAACGGGDSTNGPDSPVPVAHVSVSPSPVAKAVGETVQLEATLRDADDNILTGRTITWSSSDSDVATVDPSTGMVTAVAVGSATITATAEGVDGTGTITVTESPTPVATVEITGPATLVAAGGTLQLTAVTKDADGNVLTGRAVTWTSSNDAFATVSQTGLVSGVLAGNVVTITATSEGQTGEAEIAVVVPVATVELSAPSTSVVVGGTLQITAVTKDAEGNVLSGRLVSWESGNEASATVNATGLVTGVAGGTATITATSEGKSGTLAITVIVPVATVEVEPDERSVVIGGTVELTATTRSARGDVLTGRVVTWTSSAEDVATVDPATGVVTAVAEGAATITATSEGQTGEATITVTTGYSMIAAGQDFTCGVRAGGSAFCWGANVAGALGTGAGSDTRSPAAVAGSPGTLQFAQVSAGETHACGITGAGTAYCWGANSRGQLGTGNTTPTDAPAAVTGGLTFSMIAAGAEFTCGLTTDGAAYCWGLNLTGQLGVSTNEGTSNANSTPRAVSGGHTFVQLTAFRGFACGLESDGDVWCWGSNLSGQLGVSNVTTRSSTPLDASNGRRYTRIAAGSDHACGIEQDTEAAYCWGNNEASQLGTSSDETNASFTPVAVSGGAEFSSLTGGLGYTCGVRTDGTAVCWGNNDAGQLGDGTTGGESATPVTVASSHRFDAIDAGYKHTCGITDGTVAYCWGRQQDGTRPTAGALGNDSASDSPNPVEVAGQT